MNFTGKSGKSQIEKKLNNCRENSKNQSENREKIDDFSCYFKEQLFGTRKITKVENDFRSKSELLRHKI